MNDQPYLVWSAEHSAWWRPDYRGYTTNISKAGFYARDEAMRIVNDATFNWTEHPSEIPVALGDLPLAAMQSIGTGGTNEQVAKLRRAAPAMFEALTNIENDAGQVPSFVWTMIQDAVEQAGGKRKDFYANDDS